MQHIEGTFKGIRDLDIYYQGWLPDGEVKAVLFLVHGLGEYCGRYTNVVDHFVPLGYAIYGLDHIGHGKSGGEREMVKRLEDFNETLVTYYQMVTGWQPGKPVFIYGHSMGGLITSFHMLDHQADFKGAIISAPAVMVPPNITPVTVILGNILSRLAPKMGMIGLDTNYLSHDRAVVEAYNADPLVFHGKTPARLAAEMLRGMMRVTTEGKKISLPLFILQGSEDKIVDPAGAQMLYNLVSSQDKTLKLYPGLYHEVHNEPQRDVMFKNLEDWLAAHL
jgi:alpha-beta hydrolase superfamily lysophospholipase